MVLTTSARVLANRKVVSPAKACEPMWVSLDRVSSQTLPPIARHRWQKA